MSNKPTSKGDYFYFTKSIDDIVKVVADIAKSIDENVEDWNIIDVNGEDIAGPINSYLTADPTIWKII